MSTTTVSPSRQTSLVAPGSWLVSPAESHIGFEIKNFGLRTVSGHFESVGGVIALESDDQLPGVSASVEAGSIDTGIAKRDEHLRSAHFLDVEEHPAIQFHAERVTRVADTDGEAFEVEGTLTIKGISRDVTLSARPLAQESNDDERTVRLTAEGVIDRRDFGIEPPLPMKVTVGRSVTLRLEIVARRSDQE